MPEQPLRRRAMIVFVVALSAHAALLYLRDATRGPVRIDEAHKLSESAFAGLLLRGDISNPSWFCERVDRANPPVGKYALGLGALLGGEHPPSPPTLAAELGDDDWVPPIFSEELTRPYLPLVPPVRRFNAALTVLASAILTATMFCHAGIAGAIATWLAFALSWATPLYGSAATFEPVLVFLISVAICLGALGSKGSVVSGAVAAGLAIATRLSGAVALIGVVTVILLKKETGLRVRALLAASVLVIAGMVAVVVDPFLWARAPSTDCAAMSAGSNSPVIARPFLRMQQRLADLAVLERMLERRGLGLPVGERLSYVIEQVAGDMPGLAILLATALGLILLPMHGPGQRLAAAAAAMLAVYVAWLPFPWPRYVFIASPMLAILAGWGIASAVRWMRTRGS